MTLLCRPSWTASVDALDGGLHAGKAGARDACCPGLACGLIRLCLRMLARRKDRHHRPSSGRWNSTAEEEKRMVKARRLGDANLVGATWHVAWRADAGLGAMGRAVTQTGSHTAIFHTICSAAHTPVAVPQRM